MMFKQSTMLTGLIAAGAIALGASVPSTAQEGWTVLFDGTNLDHWNMVGDANWRIVDGAVEANMGGGHLVSKESYTDFELRAEFWVDEPANSGIFIRCDDPAMPGANSCYEVNIYDTRPEPEYGTGAIVNIASIANMMKAGGQWNTYEVRAEGDHLVVTLNGTTTVDVRDTTHPSGPITLQYGAGTVKFRKVEIRPL